MPSPSVPTVDAVLFDLFGTLVPVEPDVGWAEQMRRMAEPVGVPVDVFGAEFRASFADRMAGALTVTENIRLVCERAGVTVDDDQVAAAVRARQQILRRWLVPREPTLPALRRLRDAGVPMALVSDCSSDVVEMWPQLPMAEFFATAVLSARMRTTKPDPVMYLTACEGLGVRPERCLYVGDGNSTELTGATEVGLRAVHIDAERPAFPGPAYEGARWTGERVTSLAEIPPLVGC